MSHSDGDVSAEQLTDDPIDKMPPQLQASNRRRRAAKAEPSDHLAALITGAVSAATQPLVERLDALEAGEGRMRYVASEPEPRPGVRVMHPDVDPDSFTSKLLEKTFPVPENYGGDREPTYNVAPRWYLKPDGSFVQLQGDAKQRSYYGDKGYHVLSEAETRQFLEVERPKILARQRRKAHLVAVIRRMVTREPALAGYVDDGEFDASLDVMSIAELEDQFDDLRKRSANPDQKLPPLPRFRDDAPEHDPQMAGIETTPPKVAQTRGGRLIEVTPDTISSFR